jgi:hypothetical protein
MRLQNTTIPITANTTTNNPSTTKTQTFSPIQAKAAEVLQLSDPSKVDDIPTLCHKAIATIISKATKKLADSIWKKESISTKRAQNATKKNSSLRRASSLKQKTNPT